jgi:hypothetical protein
MSKYRNNHYVPEWYQKKFFPCSDSKFHVVDLNPREITVKGETKVVPYRSPRGSSESFCSSDLYTLYTDNGCISTKIEKELFGEIDRKGAKSFSPFLTDNGTCTTDPREYLYDFLYYLNAQRVRTPMILEAYKYFISKQGEKHLNHLNLMHSTRQDNIITWMEAYWEVVSAVDSDVKFIISDNPVTFYNPMMFHGHKELEYQIFGSMMIGTRVIFPLSKDFCLIITNREYINHPGFRCLEYRRNARVGGESMMNSDDIITGRKFSSEEVAIINFIIRSHADRYIAGSHKGFLLTDIEIDLCNHKEVDALLLPKPVIPPEYFILIETANGIKSLNEHGERLNEKEEELLMSHVKGIKERIGDCK